LTTYQRNMFLSEVTKRLGEDELDDLRRKEVGNAQERAGDDNEADHDSGGLHHLPAVRPLYSLQLAPASLKEVHDAGSRELPGAGHLGRGGATAAAGPAVLRSKTVTLIVVTPAAVSGGLAGGLVLEGL